jgi:hypothetical protein
MSLQSTEFKLNSKLQNQEQKVRFSQIESELKKEIQPLNEKLNSISKILDYLENAILNNLDLSEVKQEIKSKNEDLYSELNIENSTSLEAIKQKVL